MNFSIDPKDLNLQDAAGMQLVEVIRNLAEESGAGDYEDLENLPKINGVTLVGDKSSEDLDIAVSDEQVAEAVDAWLEDNVDPETGYVLDDSLTLSNAAAPADKVGELKAVIDDSFVDYTNHNVYEDAEDFTNAYLDTSGAAVTYANAYVSGYIPVIPGTSVKYYLIYIYGVAIAGCFYNSEKQFISDSQIVADSGTVGSWAIADGVYTVPENAAFMRYSMSVNSSGGGNKFDQLVEWESTKSLKSYVVDDIAPNVSNQWYGKKWCAFGTSITATNYTDPETGLPTGKYVPFLAETSGMIVTNRGLVGGTLARGGIHGGSANILEAILDSEDLDEFDLITIEGFVNDFAAAITIGDVGDTLDTTFCGALYQAITYCLEHSHAEVILITETTGKEYESSGGVTGDYTILHKNSLELYQQAYNDAIIRIGQYYGVHVIDAGGKSQINQYHPEYIIDQIHHTTLGGEQYAKTIWEELKNISPAKVADEESGS